MTYTTYPPITNGTTLWNYIVVNQTDDSVHDPLLNDFSETFNETIPIGIQTELICITYKTRGYDTTVALYAAMIILFILGIAIVSAIILKKFKTGGGEE